MDALILSCGTGGGHNSAARAMAEELERQGGSATIINPYDLWDNGSAHAIDRLYISTAQHQPMLFGAVYKLGQAYSKLPVRSPIYFWNRKTALKLYDYICQHSYDVIIMTHLFPAEMLSYLKSEGYKLPKTVFISTDYTCAPFTGEIICDAYIIPAQQQVKEFVKNGVPEDKIYPFGIPVSQNFVDDKGKDEAKAALGLDKSKKYILVSGGSIGASKLRKMLPVLCRMTKGTDYMPIIICGSNAGLQSRLEKRYGKRAVVLGSTDKMADYMRASQLYMTKPGGLSTTEAAAMGIPLALLPPIPGCESHNRRFFQNEGMCCKARPNGYSMGKVFRTMENSDSCHRMIEAQHRNINGQAAKDITELCKELSEVG